MRKRGRQAGSGSPNIADEEVMVRQSSIAACVTCGLCGGLLRGATTISECLHAFCRECIVDEFNHKNTSHCPKCGIDLGCDPLEKLRPDHSLECIGLVIFPSKRCKFDKISSLQPLGNRSEAENLIPREELENERAGKIAAVEKTTFLEGTPLAPVPSSEMQETEVEVEVVDENLTSDGLNHEFYVLDLAPIGRDTLARIRCRDFYMAPSLSAEAGALIVWQPPSVQRGISYDRQTAPRHSQLTTAAPVHNKIMVAPDCSDRQPNSPSSMPSATTVLAASGPSHVGTSVQYAENWRSELLSIYNDKSERTLQHIEAHIRQSPLYKEIAILEEELNNARLEKSAASERARVLEEKLQDQTESSQDIEAAQRELLQENRALKSDIFKKNEELISLKHNNNKIQNRMLVVEQRNTVLENRMNHVNKLLEAVKLNSRKLNEQLRKAIESESEQSQKNEAARRELLREYRILKSEMAKKDEELTNLKQDSLMIENMNIEVEKKNTVLEEQIDQINRLLGAEKLNSRKLNKQLRKAINEKDELMAELETYNDAPGRIQGAIRGTLSATISGLKNSSTIIKAVHYEDLLSRMNDLEQVQGHLPKIWETIKIATSLSAYGAVSVVFARLLAYHGDDFDIQRLLLPVHLSDQHFSRIRNAVEPLAAEAAEKYGLKYAD